MRKRLHRVARNAHFRLVNALSDLEGGSAPNARNVVLYTQARMAYNRIKKAANSSTLAFNAEVLSRNDLVKLDFEGLDYLSAKKAAIDVGIQLPDLWKFSEISSLGSYYWFTVVRDPYARLLSAFLEKGSQAKRGAPRYQDIPGLGNDSSAGFRDFVCFLESGGLYVNRHWWPQIELLYLPVERFDYVAKVESLRDDLLSIYNSVGLDVRGCRGFDEPHLAEAQAQGKITGSAGQMDRYYTSEIYGRVFELYSEDFKKLGYPG